MTALVGATTQIIPAYLPAGAHSRLIHGFLGPRRSAPNGIFVGQFVLLSLPLMCI